jgi:hypothetical protein
MLKLTNVYKYNLFELVKFDDYPKFQKPFSLIRPPSPSETKRFRLLNKQKKKIKRSLIIRFISTFLGMNDKPVRCHLGNVLADETFTQTDIQYFVQHSTGVWHIQTYLGQEIIDSGKTLIENC